MAPSIVHSSQFGVIVSGGHIHFIEARTASPRESGRARLARFQVSAAAFVVQIARFRMVASSGIVRIFRTLPWLERLYPGEGRGLSHPLDGLPVGDDVDVVLRVDVVDELHVAFPVVLCSEPGCVVVESERRSVRLVMSLEVLE